MAEVGSPDGRFAGMNSAARRQFRRSPRRAIVFFALLLIAVALRYGFFPAEAPSPPALDAGEYDVRRVVDGDTLLLTNGARVRMLGVDTPETVMPDHAVEPWGPEASKFTKQAIASHGGRVRLQFDRERQDRFERFLAYVWLEDKLLNEELVRRGLATAELQYNYSPAMKRRLQRAEAAARQERVGIWEDRGQGLGTRD